MNVKIYPCTLDGDVVAPPSNRRRTARCCAPRWRRKRASSGCLPFRKTSRRRALHRSGGRGRAETEGGYEITPAAGAEKAVFDCGESGSTLRFFLPVAAALGIEATFIGSAGCPNAPWANCFPF